MPRNVLGHHPRGRGAVVRAQRRDQPAVLVVGGVEHLGRVGDLRIRPVISPCVSVIARDQPRAAGASASPTWKRMSSWR